MRAIVYVRVSTDEQANGYSLQTQEKECLNWAISRGIEVTAVISDDYTGQKLERPGLSEAMKLLEVGAADLLLCHSPDRLSRILVHRTLLREELTAIGVNIAFVTRGVVGNDPASILTYNIDSVIAEYELSQIKERTMRGKVAKAERGLIVFGMPPFGYDRIGTRNEIRFVINEAEAGVVQYIFNEYVNGTPVKEIARRLTADQIPHRREKKEIPGWSPSMIQWILRNDCYIGKYREYKRKLINGRMEQRTGDDIFPASEIPPIISEELFTAAKRRTDVNRIMGARKREKTIHMLSGHIFCKCGRRCHSASNGRNWIYQCNSRALLQNCGTPSVSARIAEESVWGWITGTISSPDLIEQALEMARIECNEYDAQKRLAEIEADLGKSDDRIERLAEMRLEGFPKKQIADMLAKEHEKIALLNDEMNRLSSRPTIEIANVDEISEAIIQRLPSVTIDEKREIVDVLDIRTTVYADRLHIASAIGNGEVKRTARSGRPRR